MDYISKVITVRITQNKTEEAINEVIEEMSKKGYEFHAISGSETQFCLIFKRNC